ncbi:MAG: xylulokinase [Candidatus Heimdallarchaeota archaeon]
MNFLGLDCSTQSFTTILINFHTIVYKNTIIFDRDLPHYNTKNGAYFFEDTKKVHSNPLMWIEALELAFTHLINTEFELKQIKAISGSGQQHGTVYLNRSFEKTLQSLNPKISLKEQLRDAFSRETSPIWMDSSTYKQCQEIRHKLGGLKPTIKITGSNTFERFSGPQIRKFYQENPEAYAKTSIIHLVSSFLASVLLGRNAPIDHGDGAGMNLMNIKTKLWDRRALEATAPNLGKKLPLLCNSYNICGVISPYFVERYGFSPDTRIIAWSGDNPNSLIGVGITGKGKAAISLGTSDTYFGYMKKLSYDLSGESHVFGAPTGDYMSLICFKNGSLTREEIRNQYNLSWVQFSDILNKTPPGNYGKIMLPYVFPEIVPLILEPKVYRFGFEEDDVEGNIRGIIEAQFLSMKLHSRWIEEQPDEIYATGGASENREIIQVLSNVFNKPIRIFDISDSAALGAALRSVKSYYNSLEKGKTWLSIIDEFLEFQNSEFIKPQSEYKELYDDMLEVYRNCENYVLKKGENPEKLRKNFIKKHFKFI